MQYLIPVKQEAGILNMYISKEITLHTAKMLLEVYECVARNKGETQCMMKSLDSEKVAEENASD